MPERAAQVAATAELEPGAWRRLYAVVALVYPFFHFVTPADAIDPWWAWWSVGAAILSVLALSWVWPWLERNIAGACYLCSSFTTLHIGTLAVLNPQQPFFIVGAAISVAVTCTAIRTPFALRLYVAFGVLLLAAIAPFYPDPWDVLLCVPIPILGYSLRSRRLAAEIAAARMRARHEAELQGALDERTSELLGRTRELTDANRRLRREMEQKARLEDELRFAQKMEAVGRLAGGVAHEFNNRLTAIGVYAELLLERLPEGSPLRNEVLQIQRAEEKAASLTRQLLTFSRRGEVRADILDLNAVIEETSSLLRHLLGEDSRLVCLFGEGAHIRAEREELEQVLVNLALNARDAMPAGGELSIETSLASLEMLKSDELPSTLTEDAYVILRVSDTGVGMDPETAARAFDPFFTRKPVDQGTGLGLSFVYGVVKQARGHIRVLSEHGKGATFELYWPRAVRPATGPEPPAPIRAPDRGDEHILLVEDDEDVRAALERTLSDRGYRVTEAGSGETALRIVTSGEAKVDLVLSDVVMPGMGGIELVEALASKAPETRVMLMSGQLNHPSLRQRELPPGVAFLQKPFHPRALLARIRAVLDA